MLIWDANRSIDRYQRLRTWLNCLQIAYVLPRNNEGASGSKPANPWHLWCW